MRKNVRDITRVAVEKYLLKHGSITGKDALLVCGCYRLSARIYELRHRYGYIIGKRTEIRKDAQTGLRTQICHYLLEEPGERSFIE